MSAEFTVRLKPAVAIAPLASVTVTVYGVAALEIVGVPLIVPVDGAILKLASKGGDTL